MIYHSALVTSRDIRPVALVVNMDVQRASVLTSVYPLDRAASSAVTADTAVFEDVICPHKALRYPTVPEWNQRLVSEGHAITYREELLGLTAK